jgi:hypothetical protein
MNRSRRQMPIAVRTMRDEPLNGGGLNDAAPRNGAPGPMGPSPPPEWMKTAAAARDLTDRHPGIGRSLRRWTETRVFV